MNLKDFDYELPDSLIAAYPSREREASRLLVIRRDTGEIIHSVFSDLGNFLDAGDLLVLNDTKVFPARLMGNKDSGGKVEVLLLELEEELLLMAIFENLKAHLIMEFNASEQIRAHNKTASIITTFESNS